MITSWKMRRAKQVAGIWKKRNAYRVLIEKHEQALSIWPMIGTKTRVLLEMQ
jgi:hypothetical protein